MRTTQVAFLWVAANIQASRQLMKKNRFILTLSCFDAIGIVAAVTTTLAKNNCFIFELSQFSDPTTHQFFMRIDFHAPEDKTKEDLASYILPIASSFAMVWNLQSRNKKTKTIIMVSKLGHCLNDLLHRYAMGTIPVEIIGIFSNHQTYAKMAAHYHIPFYYFPIQKGTKELEEKKMIELMLEKEIELIILARYMQILSPSFCQQFLGKMINIHHSFLPSFKGAKPYHQAYLKGVKLIGATAHYVTADLDEGPIIEQETISVRHDHTPKQLTQYGCDIECRVLARALLYHVENRIFLNGTKTVIFS